MGLSQSTNNLRNWFTIKNKVLQVNFRRKPLIKMIKLNVLSAAKNRNKNIFTLRVMTVSVCVNRSLIDNFTLK